MEAEPRLWPLQCDRSANDEGDLADGDDDVADDVDDDAVRVDEGDELCRNPIARRA